MVRVDEVMGEAGEIGRRASLLMASRHPVQADHPDRCMVWVVRVVAAVTALFAAASAG